jgi:ubiquinone/menaquinone biosynthesis C-methylase UbiE
MQLQQEKTTNAPSTPPEMAMLQMTSGYWISQSIYAAAKLGIPDLLKDGPKSCEEIAAATGTKARALYRVMRALAQVGVFAEVQEGSFTLTPLSDCLRSDVPGSVRAITILFGEEQYKAWGDILYSMRTGESSFEHKFGMPVFQYYSQNPESGKIFNEAMTSGSDAEKAEVVKCYDFSTIHKLVDIGGGQGSFISSILKANPTLQGVLFDLPSVVEVAPDVISAEGVGDRCEIVGGSFYDSVPSGADAYILKHVLHDWDDETSLTILKNCHRAMAENGKLLVVEQVVPPGNEPALAKFMDVNMMMLHPGGCERTEAEYQALFEAAGFQLTKTIPTQAMVSVIEAVRV